MKFTLNSDRPRPRRGGVTRNHFALNAAGGRLVFLVFLLIMVIWAMFVASKPESWYWLVGESPQETVKTTAGPEATAEPGGQPSSDIAPPAKTPLFDSIASKSQSSQIDDHQFDIRARRGQTAAELAHRLRLDFWKETIDLLEPREQLLLLTLVQHGAEQKPLEAGQTAAVNSLLVRVANRRQAYHVTLLEQFATRSRPDQTAPPPSDAPAVDESASLALVEITRVWDEEIKPALQAVVDDDVNQDRITTAVKQFPTLLQDAATQLVRDHTQVGRRAEAYAWFAAWQSVFDAPLHSDEQSAVSITSLLAQPAAYRGQTVTVRGEALRIDRVSAARNPLGIGQYFVVWIKPDHASTLPFCLYTLMLPESLETDDTSSLQAINVPIQVNARFFKVRLFDAGEPAQAPLLMSSTFEIVDSVDLATQRSRNLPGSTANLLMILLIVVLTTSIAWRVYRSSTVHRRRISSSDKQLEGNLEALKQDERVQTVAEKLDRMASSDQTTGKE